MAQNTSRCKSAVHDHIAAADGCIISHQKRKLIEQGFVWTKLTGPIRQVMVHRLEKVDQLFVLTMATYKLTRMRALEQIRADNVEAGKRCKTTSKQLQIDSQKVWFPNCESDSRSPAHADGEAGFAY